MGADLPTGDSVHCDHCEWALGEGENEGFWRSNVVDWWSLLKSEDEALRCSSNH